MKQTEVGFFVVQSSVVAAFSVHQNQHATAMQGLHCQSWNCSVCILEKIGQIQNIKVTTLCI